MQFTWRHSFALFLLASTLGAASSAEQFSPATRYPVGSGTFYAVIGDFNGDGIPDIAADYIASPSGIGILLGNGDGTFRPALRYAEGKTPTYMVAADFNGDQKLDLAFLDTTLNEIVILLGNGDASFQAPKFQHAGIKPEFLSSSDLNNDGKPDLVAVDFSRAVNILLGNGDGTFQRSTIASGPYPDTEVAGDLNGDGFPDIVVGGGAPQLTVLLGNGDGTFQLPVAYKLPMVNSSYNLGLGDFNNDGKLDVVAVLDPEVNKLVVAMGKGDGTLTAPKLTKGPVSLGAMASADFDQSGSTDLIFGSLAPHNHSVATLLLGNGDGTFGQEQFYRTSGGAGSSVAVADLNGDGYPDVVLVTTITGSSGVNVLLNVGAQAKVKGH